MELNRTAWAILLEDEKMALNLQYGHSKSSWAAGELMNKAHYKFLEIKYRAEHFLKLFTTHFELYDTLIPEKVKMSDQIRYYLTKTIVERVPLKEVHTQMDEAFGKTSKITRAKELTTFIVKNEESPSMEIVNFINLIKDFDRWNNFRILPKEIQEPSAYKRRNKNLHRKHIRVLTKLSPLALDILRKTLFCKSPTGKYVVIIPNAEEVSICNLRMKLVNKCGEFGFYIWSSKELAETYANLLYNYLKPDKRTCKDGLDFWPGYREHIKLADNYEKLQGLKPNRRFLEMAVTKLEFYNQEKK